MLSGIYVSVFQVASFLQISSPRPLILNKSRENLKKHRFNFRPFGVLHNSLNKQAIQTNDKVNCIKQLALNAFMQ